MGIYLRTPGAAGISLDSAAAERRVDNDNKPTLPTGGCNALVSISGRASLKGTMKHQ